MRLPKVRHAQCLPVEHRRHASSDALAHGAMASTRVLLESIPSAVFSVDEQLRFRFANPAAEQLFGASWNVLAGRRWRSSWRRTRRYWL